MSTAQDVIDSVRFLINDEAPEDLVVLWSDEELLTWISDAQREVVRIKPEATAVTDTLTVTAGRPRQRLTPVDGFKLIRVEANKPAGVWESEVTLECGGYQNQQNGHTLSNEVSAIINDLFGQDPLDLYTDSAGAISGSSNGRTILGILIFDNTSFAIALEGPDVSDNLPSSVEVTTSEGTVTLQVSAANTFDVIDGDLYVYWNDFDEITGSGFFGTVSLVLRGVEA